MTSLYPQRLNSSKNLFGTDIYRDNEDILLFFKEHHAEYLLEKAEYWNFNFETSAPSSSNDKNGLKWIEMKAPNKENDSQLPSRIFNEVCERPKKISRSTIFHAEEDDQVVPSMSLPTSPCRTIEFGLVPRSNYTKTSPKNKKCISKPSKQSKESCLLNYFSPIKKSLKKVKKV
uniref:Cyclin-dependent kinase inhibitor domain-containing protein n=1 Tax=Rhabditophanes sp. KR3021 TaxID=114890 RepID=A0AC35UFJ1_9BILA